jgi:signal transduction histidine kinase
MTVVRRFALEVPLLHADRQQLRQVFLNLLTNASRVATAPHHVSSEGGAYGGSTDIGEGLVVGDVAAHVAHPPL